MQTLLAVNIYWFAVYIFVFFPQRFAVVSRSFIEAHRSQVLTLDIFQTI